MGMKVIFLSVMLFLSFQFIAAQDVDQEHVKVEMQNGSVYIGVVVSEDDTTLVLRTEDIGEIRIDKSNIKHRNSIDPDKIENGEAWFENPNSTRYLFATNGLGLKKGEGYYQNTWIFFNNVNYGVTQNFSLGGGLIPTFLFGTTAVPIWVMPKASIPLVKDNLHAAVGGLFGGVVGDGESFGLGLAYGVLTYGNTDNNLTFGMGYGYADGTWADIPIFTLSGMYRIKEKLYLISENYFVVADGESVGMLSGALRWSPDNFAVDFGLIRPTDIGLDFIGVPWLGVSIPFGR